MKETVSVSGKIQVVRCRACRREFAFTEVLPHKCPSCCTFNALEHAAVDARPEPTPAAPLVALSGTSLDKTSARMLGDLVVEPFEPYPTGVETWDDTIGGLANSFVVFLAGGKGVGKTTIVTKLSIVHCIKNIERHTGTWDPASFEIDENRRVFLASAEEPLQRYLLRLWRLKFLKFDPEKLKLKLPFSECVVETPETRVFIQILKKQFMGSKQNEIIAVLEQARKLRPTLMVFDSIRKFTHRDVKGTSPLTHGPAVVQEIIDFAEETKCCCIGIKRLTKAGLVAGNEDEGYDVDCVAHLDRVKNGMKRRLAAQGVSGRIVKLSTEKNRLGDDEKKGLFVLCGEGMLSVARDGTLLDPRPAPPKEGPPCRRTPSKPAAPRPARKSSVPSSKPKRSTARRSRTRKRRS